MCFLPKLTFGRFRVCFGASNHFTGTGLYFLVQVRLQLWCTSGINTESCFCTTTSFNQ